MRALVLVFCFLPTLALATRIGGDFWLDGRQMQILWRSVWMSAAATAMALVWGWLAALAARRRPIWEALAVAPLLMPPMVLCMGWIYFAGTWWNLRTPLGAAFVLSMSTFPVVTILAMQAWRAMNPEWDRVGRLHAGKWRTFWRIERPLAAPYLWTAATIVFLLCFADFNVPSALGVAVYPFEIFTEFESAQFGRAVALVLPPIAIAVALSFLRRPIPQTVGVPSRFAARSTWALPGAAVIVVAVALPLAALAGTIRGASGFRDVSDNVRNSIVLSIFASLGILLAATLLTLKRFGRFMESAVLLPLVIPGAAVGLGIAILGVRGAPAMTWALFCRMLTIPTLVLAASRASIRERVHDACAVSGIGPWQTGLRVTLPLALPGVLAAALTAFVLCLGELAAVAVVNAPGWETLTMRVGTLLHVSDHSTIAAVCLSLAALSAAALAAGLFNRHALRR